MRAAAKTSQKTILHGEELWGNAGTTEHNEGLLERVPFPHRQRREALVAERSGKRRHGAPSGAMAGRDDRRSERAHGINRLRDDLFVGTRKMKAAHDRMDRNAGEPFPGVSENVDDAGMRT